MIKKEFKYIIIGAGVSGLTTAYQLLKKGETDFIILEARDRIGGRVLTSDNVDLEPAWFQANHENLIQLLNNLEIPKFNQYSKGKSILVHNAMAPAHYFNSDQSQPSAYRISGGTEHLISKLANLVHNKVSLSTKVNSIEEVNNYINISTNTTIFKASKVIVTLPPKLATRLSFKPELPSALKLVMKKTHTWMSNAIKVGITFKIPFWREQGFSGTIISQISPVTELYDHSSANQKHFSLMGFVNEGLRDLTKSDRKEQILSYLEKHLGSQIRDFTSYQEKDWSQDEFTSITNLQSVHSFPQYGNPVFTTFYMNNKLLFSGTETSPYFGGYLEGAVISGVLAANKL